MCRKALVPKQSKNKALKDAYKTTDIYDYIQTAY